MGSQMMDELFAVEEAISTDLTSLLEDMAVVVHNQDGEFVTGTFKVKVHPDKSYTYAALQQVAGRIR